MKIINAIKLSILCLFAVLMIIIAYQTSFEQEFDGLEVTFLDVGQGDCAYIKTPDNHRILIDSGDEGSYEKYIKAFLGRKRVKFLDAAVVSHYDADHFYGLYEMLGIQKVNKIYVPDTAAHNYLSEMLSKKCEYNNVDCVPVKSGNIIYEGEDGVKISVLFPDKNIYTNENDASENNDSMVIMLEYKEKKFLFMGDVEKDAEEALVENADLDADVLKVAHHGSDTSSIEPFIAEVSPEYSVISCGVNNQYGLPASEVVKRLKNSGSRLFRTDENGDVSLFVNDSGEISIKTSE